MPRVLLTNKYDAMSFAVLKKHLPKGFELRQLPEISQEALMEAVPWANYLIASGRLAIDADVINAAKCLYMVSRTGVGIDTIDLAALKDRSIPLFVNPGVNAKSVAEYTIMLILASLKNLAQVNDSTKEGQWLKRPFGIRTHELFGKQVFVVGLGNVGQRVVQLLQPFGCQVDGASSVDSGGIPDAFFEADIVSLHCPLTAKTRNLLNEEVIAKMKSGCIVVNTARGGLIDEPALAVALKTGQIGFAALDVRSSEPPLSAMPFQELSNVLLTPHIAGITHESFESMIIGAIDNIVAFNKGDYELIEHNRVEE